MQRDSKKVIKMRSMGINALLSSLKILSSIIFPLITYPYITERISVTNIGKINFSQSIISYFTLIAAFGISGFAVRTGSRIRDDRIAFEAFADRVFTINVITTAVSLLLLLLLILLPTKLVEYRTFICILSVTVALVPISVDWVYMIYEDFAYVTVRSILISLLSIILMLVFVKDNNDVYLYVGLTTASNSLGNIFNFFHAKKFVRLGLTKDTHWRDYSKPLWIFFINSVTSTIYLNSDMTLLGLMSTNRQVALYSIATKIYSIAQQMIYAVVTTIIPRLAYIQKKSEDEFIKLLKNIVEISTFFVIPLMVGLVMVGKNIVLILSNSKYIKATESLSILAVALIFSVFAGILANGLLIVINRERAVVTATIASAIINLCLNFFFIPLWGQNGAAATTLIAEITILSISIWFARDYFKNIVNYTELLKAILGSIIMYIVNQNLSQFYSSNNLVNICEIVIISVVVYFVSMIILKDNVLFGFLSKIKARVNKDYRHK